MVDSCDSPHKHEVAMQELVTGKFNIGLRLAGLLLHLHGFQVLIRIIGESIHDSGEVDKRG